MSQIITAKRWLLSLALMILTFSISGAQASEKAPAFDWTKHGVTTPVRDQGNSNNCWAVAATETLEANWTIRHNKKVQLSPQPILDRTHQSGPDRLSTAFGVLKQYGTASESSYPYLHIPGKLKNVSTPYRLARWEFVVPSAARPTIAQVKKSMAQHGPLAVGVYATNKFKSYRGGVYSEALNNGNPNSMDHFVLMVGWDDAKHAWKIKNSWGTSWGEQGYMWITFGSDHIGSNAAWAECVTTASHPPVASILPMF